MADIRPFRAYRPRKDLTTKVAALPYDVYSEQEARDYIKDHPGCFLEIDRPESFFSEGQDPYAPEVYQKASEVLHAEMADGTFVREEKPSYYLYEQTFNGRTQTGIVALASIDDYLNNVIKKHENTREEKEQDRIRHVDICNAQTGPIFLCYRKREDLHSLVQKIRESGSFVSFGGPDGTMNRIFVIDDEADVEMITKAFADTSSVYIADGHHRCASAVKVGLKRRDAAGGKTGLESDYFLSILFADEELEIMDYNRVVRDLNGMTREELLDKIAKSFDVEVSAEQVKPAQKGTFGMYLEGSWYVLRAHQDIMSTDPVEGLDVSVLQKNLLAPILGIGDPRTDDRIDFVGGIRGLGELEKRCGEDMRIAFSLHPTSIKELFTVADAGLLMPPKSTWFEPKLLSGLFVHALEEDDDGAHEMIEV